jgi:hypothetical protein
MENNMTDAATIEKHECLIVELFDKIKELELKIDSLFTSTKTETVETSSAAETIAAPV